MNDVCISPNKPKLKKKHSILTTNAKYELKMVVNLRNGRHSTNSNIIEFLHFISTLIERFILKKKIYFVPSYTLIHISNPL